MLLSAFIHWGAFGRAAVAGCPEFLCCIVFVTIVNRIRLQRSQGACLPSPEDDYVGINEIAEFAKTSRQAVANWRARFKEFGLSVDHLRTRQFILPPAANLASPERSMAGLLAS